MEMITAIKTISYNLGDVISDIDDGTMTEEELRAEAIERIQEWAEEDLNNPDISIHILDEDGEEVN